MDSTNKMSECYYVRESVEKRVFLAHYLNFSKVTSFLITLDSLGRDSYLSASHLCPVHKFGCLKNEQILYSLYILWPTQWSYTVKRTDLAFLCYFALIEKILPKWRCLNFAKEKSYLITPNCLLHYLHDIYTCACLLPVCFSCSKGECKEESYLVRNI